MKEIVAPDGEVWRVGDKVWLEDPEGIRSPTPTEIAVIYPGDGSWEREQPDGDTNAVWFQFTNGWMARPWLVKKR
jgi:hypothetical protein